MTNSPENKCSPITSEDSQMIERRNSNAQQTILAQAQSTAEMLQQINTKFDSSYLYYNCWLIMMIQFSGVFAGYLIVGTFCSVINHGISDRFPYFLLSVALSSAFFAQFVVEKWAISTRDLATANLALKIITVNTCLLLALNAWTGYDLYDYSRNITEHSESTVVGKAIRTIFFIAASFLSVTQIFITRIQAVKVRNDLAKRETIRADLQDPASLLPILSV